MPPAEPTGGALPSRPRSLLRAGLTVLAGMLLAGLTLQQSALAYWRAADPASVPGVLSGDPLIRVAASDVVLSEDNPPRAAMPAIAAAARAALRMSPLTPDALRQLGTVAKTRHDAGAAARYFGLADTIARRDLVTQEELIEIYTARGDIGSAMRHYDRALSVYNYAMPELFADFRKILRRPDGQRELARYAGRQWFVPYMLDQLRDPDDLGDLTGFLDRVRPSLSRVDSDKLASAMLGRLMRAGQFAAAADWLGRTEPGLAPALTTFGVTSLTTDPRLGPLAWTFPPHDGIELTREASGTLAITVEPGRPAAAGERLTLLPPGPYLLDLRVARAGDSPPARLTIDLACKSGTGDTVQNRFSAEPDPVPTTVRLSFDLPVTCQAQHWSVGATSLSIEAPATVILSGMTLSRRQLDEGQPVGPKAP